MMQATEETADANDIAVGEAGNEDALIGRIQAGDTRAYEIIMRKYNQRLYRIARSILKNESEAEDAVQDAYVRAYYNLKRYNPTGRFGAWLGRIAVNEALMRRRKSKTDRFDEFKTVDDVAGNNLTALAGQRDPSEEAAGEELVKLVEDAIDSLPTDFRVVFVMRSIEQMSTSETAEALDIKAATVKTRHFRARQLIQSRLERKISLAELRSYEFAGERCDRIVARVYAALGHER